MLTRRSLLRLLALGAPAGALGALGTRAPSPAMSEDVGQNIPLGDLERIQRDLEAASAARRSGQLTLDRLHAAIEDYYRDRGDAPRLALVSAPDFRDVEAEVRAQLVRRPGDSDHPEPARWFTLGTVAGLVRVEPDRYVRRGNIHLLSEVEYLVREGTDQRHANAQQLCVFCDGEDVHECPGGTALHARGDWPHGTREVAVSPGLVDAAAWSHRDWLRA